MDEPSDAETLAFAPRLIDASPDAMLALSLDGRVLFWSRGAETLFGHAAGDALGARCEELLVPREQRPELKHVFSTAPGGGACLEAPLLRQDGTIVRVELFVRRVESSGAEPFVAVTARLAAGSWRAERDTPYRPGPARISHDLRTPLNTIIGFAQLMREGKVGPVSASHQEYLGDILASSRDLLKLIHELFDAAPADAANAGPSAPSRRESSSRGAGEP